MIFENELGIPSNEGITGIEYDYAWGKYFHIMIINHRRQAL